MGILWALGAATTYGIADYLGGRATRHSPAPAVTFAGQSVALLLLCGLVYTSGVSVMSRVDFFWSMGAGFGGALALITFYRAMALGPMTVVAPITAVVNIAMPVIVGIAQGERPTGLSYLGIALAPFAVALIGDVLSWCARHARKLDVSHCCAGRDALPRRCDHFAVSRLDGHPCNAN
ncbi:MAG: EamA family transporter [Actinobacteria bacterium]|nr:EamA family transporter [Actinomycetota bacterium]